MLDGLCGLWMPGCLLLGQGTPPEAAGGVGLFQYIHEGGVLSYVLIALSIGAVALGIRNFLYLRDDVHSPPELLAQIDQLCRAGAFREAEALCQQPQNDCFLGRVVGSALSRMLSSPFGVFEFRAALEESAPAEVDRLHRANDGMGIIAAVAPMMGLLGTVIGMIGAFRTIGTLTGTQRSNQLATFMSMALVNTCEGLVIAIPATIAFALFRRRIDEMVARIGGRLERLASIVQSAPPAAAPVRAATRPQMPPAMQRPGGAAAPGAVPPGVAAGQPTQSPQRP